MSRYRIPSDRFDIWTGWSPEMRSFFAQVWPVEDDLVDDPILWVGTSHDEIQSLEILRRHLRPSARIPDEIVFSLNIDFALDQPKKHATTHLSLQSRCVQREKRVAVAIVPCD